MHRFSKIFSLLFILSVIYCQKDNNDQFKLKKCLNDCSNSGFCNRLEGVCLCNEGFRGNDCSERLLLEKGRKNWKGKNSTILNIIEKENEKNEKSKKDDNEKKTKSKKEKNNEKNGFGNIPIVEPIKKCSNGCSGNGFCDFQTNKCVCGAGFYGESCEKEVTCLNNCNDNGFCNPFTGKCFCSIGFKGEDCSDSSKNPHKNEKVKNYIQDTVWKKVTESLNSTFNVSDISVNYTNLAEECPNNCSKPNGFCNIVFGNCHCHYGFKGKDCSQKVTCPNNCSSNGYCNKFNGECICKIGFDGEDCSNEIKGTGNGCMNNCSGHGFCLKKESKCYCYEGWFDEDCSTKR